MLRNVYFKHGGDPQSGIGAVHSRGDITFNLNFAIFEFSRSRRLEDATIYSNSPAFRLGHSIFIRAREMVSTPSIWISRGRYRIQLTSLIVSRSHRRNEHSKFTSWSGDSLTSSRNFVS